VPRATPKESRAERNGGDSLPVRVAVDPFGEEPRESHVLPEARFDAGPAERAEHHPELEGAEAAAELRPPVHVVLNRTPLRRLEERRDQGEGALEHLWLPAEERRAV